METKKLSFQEMVGIEAGCPRCVHRVMAIAGTLATIASFAGPIGAIIAALTALGMGIGSIFCAFHETT